MPIIILLLLTFVSCSHKIIVKTPASRFLNAEAKGEPFKGNVLFYINEGVQSQVDLRNGRSDNPLVLDRDGDANTLMNINLSGEVGVWGPVDIVHISGGRYGADMSGFKAQVYGKTRKDAGIHNFSVSLIGGYGQVTNNVQEGDDFELVPQDDDTTSELQISNHTAGLLVGCRVKEKTVVNLGFYSVFHNFHGDLESQNVSLDGRSINYKGRSSITSLSLMQYSGSALFGLEMAYEELQWDKTNSVKNLFGNLSVGFHW